MTTRPQSVAALGAIVVAIGLNRLWEALYGPHFIIDVTPLGEAFAGSGDVLRRVLLEQIGSFNYIEFGLPPAAYDAWFVLVVLLVGVALVVGRRRERLVVAVSVVAAPALALLLDVAIMRHTGYRLQGRYVLPFSVVVPLLAGEVIYRRRAALGDNWSRILFVAVAAVAAVVQLEGWYVNAHRFAVGLDGPRWFFDRAEWSPPLGWWPWVGVASLGALLLAGAGALQWLVRGPGWAARQAQHAAPGTTAPSGESR